MKNRDRRGVKEQYTGRIKRSLFVLAFGAALLTGSASAAGAAEALSPSLIQASSTLSDEGSINYNAWNVCDNDVSTAWAENAPSNGVGEFLDFSFPAGTRLTGGSILPGYAKSEDLFYRNSAPSMIRISSGGDQRVVDVKRYATVYDPNARGFDFPIEPAITSNGTVRVEILDVRSGWEYEDCCISELHFSGTAGGGSGDPGNPGGQTGSALYNPDANTISRLASMAKWAYEKHTGRKEATADDIRAWELTSQDKAFLLYWYQYNVDDFRIYNTGENNAISCSLLPDILKEITGSCNDQDIEIFCRDYANYYDGFTVLVGCTGDFGDAGFYYFDDAVKSGVVDGRLAISGNVWQYGSGGYKPVTKFTAWFSPKDYGFYVNYQFDEVKIGDGGSNGLSNPVIDEMPEGYEVF